MDEWLQKVREVLTSHVGATEANSLILSEATMLAWSYGRGESAELSAMLILGD